MSAGVDRPLGELLTLVRSVAGGIDVDGLDVPEAVRVVEECAEAERVLAALRVVVTATLENKAVWRREGYRSVAAWMAAKTGTPVGSAVATLEMAKLLRDLPVLAAAFRDGLLSEVQAREIADVVSEVPDAEAHLVDAAGKLTLRALRDECQRVEAAALIDEEERHRRVHKNRHVRGWVRRGVGHLKAEMTPGELARVMARVNDRTNDIVAEAIRGRWFESREAHSVDALVDLLGPDGAGPAGPGTMVHVVVDYDALVRGHTMSGERCEIPGVGPIPVSVARAMSQDAILKVLVTKGVDVLTVAHAGYTIPAHLRSALEVRDPTCIVPGCDIRWKLEIDHRNSFSRTRVTKLEDLARLCRWHHHQKTFLGYTYRGGPDTWQWIPPENRDVDLTPLRRIIITAKRC
jgi:5-methylcytosine-specific restriction endonuclease McrA